MQQQHQQQHSQTNDQRVQYYIRIHDNWIQLANRAHRDISLLLSWPRLDYSTNVEHRTFLEKSLLHALYYATASKALVEYYKARRSGTNEDNYTRPESPPLPPQMGGREDFWMIRMIQQPVTAPPNQPDTANIGHDAQLAIQHAPQQVCKYYSRGNCFYGNACRNSHEPTNGQLNNENDAKRIRTRGGRRNKKNKGSDGG